jgi:hypothetical protein
LEGAAAVLDGFQAAGQRRRLGNAAITVYEQHGVLDARTFPLFTWYAHMCPPGPW